jgi:hypothetical protein
LSRAQTVGNPRKPAVTAATNRIIDKLNRMFAIDDLRNISPSGAISRKQFFSRSLIFTATLEANAN